jgi:hypothetical protein
MRFPPFAAALVSLSALAIGSGCAAPRGDDSSEAESVGRTTQAIEPVTAVSGGFGILNGIVTAYTHIDNLSRYGTVNVQGETLQTLKEQALSINELRASQDAKFTQVDFDIVSGPINDAEGKISRAWDKWQTEADAGLGDQYVPLPQELTWNDIDVMHSRLVGAGGMTGAFALVGEKMLNTPSMAMHDALGTYAVRMRMRLAQATFLMTRKTAISPAELAKYASQVEELNAAFANATRAYFQKRVEPLEGSTGVSTRCKTYSDGATAYFYFTVNSGDDDSQDFFSFAECESGRKDWQFQAAWQKRVAILNTMFNEQENFVNWKKRKATIHVTGATLQGRDVTQALTFMCNTQENCSAPASTVASRIGINTSQPTGNLVVRYLCNGSNGESWREFAPGQDILLHCNLKRALSGEYVNRENDAIRKRTDADYVTILPVEGLPLLTWKNRAGVDDGTLQHNVDDWSKPTWYVHGPNDDYRSVPLTVAWGDFGVPESIVGPDGLKYSYLSPVKPAADPSFTDYAL